MPGLLRVICRCGCIACPILVCRCGYVCLDCAGFAVPALGVVSQILPSRNLGCAFQQSVLRRTAAFCLGLDYMYPDRLLLGLPDEQQLGACIPPHCSRHADCSVRLGLDWTVCVHRMLVQFNGMQATYATRGLEYVLLCPG